jgi:hypothetical protein
MSNDGGVDRLFSYWGAFYHNEENSAIYAEFPLQGIGKKILGWLRELAKKMADVNLQGVMKSTPLICNKHVMFGFKTGLSMKASMVPNAHPEVSVAVGVWPWFGNSM